MREAMHVKGGGRMLQQQVASAHGSLQKTSDVALHILKPFSHLLLYCCKLFKYVLLKDDERAPINNRSCFTNRVHLAAAAAAAAAAYTCTFHEARCKAERCAYTKQA
jgi:hypothetical protein